MIRKISGNISSWLKESTVSFSVRRITLICLIAGSLMRLIWPSDMEWKVDEIWMYETAAAVNGGAEPWPAVGMPSGGGMKNPGLSIWLFIWLQKIAVSPVALVMAIMLLNVAVLWGLYLLILRWRSEPEQRDPLFWALAIFAVSPLPVLFSRKIWAQDVLPAFTLIILLAHYHRRHVAAAFFWGLFGALCGQVHMSGFFFAFGLFLQTLIRDFRKSALRDQLRGYAGWFFGSLAGSLPMLPWLQYLLHNREGSNFFFWEIFTFKYYTQWFGAAWGINMKEYLGDHFWKSFLLQPDIGFATALVAIAHLLLLAFALHSIVHWLRLKWKDRHLQAHEPMHEHLEFLLKAAGWSIGLTFTFSGFSVHAHYLIILFPLPFLWLVRQYRRHARILLIITISQLIITASFLKHVHEHDGIADADYGTVFRKQNYRPPCFSRDCRKSPGTPGDHNR